MKLSVLMPAFNERKTIGTVIALVRDASIDVQKELVIVDDGSTDGTREYLQENFTVHRETDEAQGIEFVSVSPNCDVGVIFHEKNHGKGGAIHTAMRHCTGDVIVIQDTDLEYDPADLGVMYDLIARRKIADVVYGSRFFGKPHRSLNFHHYVANRVISTLFNILYNQTLTDIEVCYKMFTRSVMESLELTQKDFGFEIQLSAQIARKKHFRIYEVAVHYFGRNYSEGKKINWRDGLKALWYLLKFRII